MTRLKWCERFVYLDRELIRFDHRPYLPPIYDAAGGNLVVRASRQVEKSTLLTNCIVHECCTRPGVKILFVAPRAEQARVFVRTRLIPAIEQSPVIRRTLVGRRPRRLPVNNMEFANGSRVFFRACFHSADASRGLSADLLMVDEIQDIGVGSLPVLQETLSHAEHPRTLLTGTPKLVDSDFEGIFRQSTANEWTVNCRGCGRGVVLDERCLGPAHLTCLACEEPIDPQAGRWVARNPQATWGRGYWLSHLLVPWLAYDEILERQRVYDPVRFRNEVLGLPTQLGELVVTRAELEACCGTTPMIRALSDVPPAGRDRLVAGIDWGGGSRSRTVLVIGYMQSDYVFRICRMEVFQAAEDPDYVITQITERCRRFNVRWIGADGGGSGHVFNRLLVDRLGRPGVLWAIVYSQSEQPPRQEGAIFKWTVHRSASIGTLFGRIKKRSLVFPRREESGSFLDEFACVTADYDDEMRTVRYIHPESQPDDAMHATNYGLLVATYAFGAGKVVTP